MVFSARFAFKLTSQLKYFRFQNIYDLLHYNVLLTATFPEFHFFSSVGRPKQPPEHKT